MGVKNYIKNLLDNCTMEGMEPSVNDIYERIEVEFGLEPRTVDDLIEASMLCNDKRVQVFLCAGAASCMHTATS